MLKKIYISIFFMIFVLFVSCEINPLVGVGSTVDTIAPEVVKVTPADCSYVRDDFDFIVTCYDNLLVTKAKLEIEKNGEKIFEKSERVSSEKTAGYQTWKVPISLKNDLKISSDKQEGEFKIIVYVYDERENISENSYKSVTIVVDVDTADADIYYPELFTKSKCESLRTEEIKSENFTIFQNSTFQINGECNDNSSIQSVYLTLKNENGEIVKSVSLDEAFESNKKYVSGSLYNWKLTLSTAESSDDSAISLEIPSFTDTYFYEVFMQVKDAAGNITFTEGNGYEEALGKSFGWFAVRQTADYPFSDFSSINDKVSVNSVLTGKSYDDDGIAVLNIYRKPLESADWELVKSYSKDGNNADESLEGTPQVFTWKISSPENSTSSSYQLKVEVIDINGKSSVEGYEKNYLSQDRIFCSFGIVDPTAPSIEPIDLADFKNIVDKDGNFTITVKASDNSAVRKIYLAWKPENTENLPKWNNFADQNLDEYKDEDGIKYWNISPKDAVKEAEESLILNIYDDFEYIYDKKVFYVYAEDDSGKCTEITSSMPKFTEMPEVKFTSPASGAVETTYNNQQFNIEAEVYSYIKLKSIEIYYDESNIYNVDIDELIPTYDENSQLWKYKCSVSSTQWWKSGEGEGSYSLTSKVKDVFNNINIDMLSFDIDNGVPKIKSVNAETEPGSYCAGSEIEIFVEMKKEVSVEAANKENLTLSLNNGGTAYYNAAATGNGKTRKIYFTYTVEAAHSSGALDAVMLKLNNAKIYDDVGNINGLTGTTGNINIDYAISIEKNSSSMLIIDNTPPKIINVTSITPNGSYTSGDKVNVIVEFDEKVTVSGKPILTLDSSSNQTAEYEKIENDTQLYFTYSVKSNVNIDLLEWESLNEGESGVIKDYAINNKNSADSGNKVDFSTLKYSANVSLAKSGQKIKIDNEAPKYQRSIPMYNSNKGLSFKIIFNEPVYKVAGKKAVLHRRADAVPIVLSVDKYNEYVAIVPKIANYYEKGVNGASSNFKIDNTTKYILKYEYEPTNENLLELFKSEQLGFYTQEFMMESDWVTNSDNSILITIPQASLLTGENYWLTIEPGFAEDKVTIPYPNEYSSEIAITQAGTKAQPPVIRIKKITGGDAQTTTMKINTITKGASVKCNTSGGTPSTLCSGEITLGSSNYTNAAYKITASAQIGSGEESSYGYEIANKTVIYTSHGVKSTDDEVYFRGSNVEKGTATVPNFPFSWDEASSPLMWKDRASAAESGMIKATKSGDRYYVVSWGVTDTLYFRPLSCKSSSNGYLIWAWGQNGSAKVFPGEISDSKSDYETNYHDRFGKNYN